MNDNVEKTAFGYEVTWIKTEDYTGKILVFDVRNAKSPMVFHRNTTKTWFVNSGKFKVSWIDIKDGKLYEKELGEGNVFHATPCSPCGLEVLSDTGSVSQVSNKDDKDDSFYLSDAPKK
tara:strand:+ start:4103 stop:4459 length:357 start_codon:yes stop_codon:yes gene_type:complete